MRTQYDYIFSGLGASGFSLLLRLIRLPGFNEKRILLIDQDIKDKNDRTWCFWEEKEGFFESIVSNKWRKLEFNSPLESKNLSIHPFIYKMIRGNTFYEFCWKEIKQHDNIDFLQENIIGIESNKITTETGTFIGDHIFNSAVFEISPKKNEHYLLQHFKGWRIQAKEDVFNPEIATLMDFRVHQEYGCSFVYVMPLNSREALVEYTLFTKDLLNQTGYDKELRNYINTYLDIKEYEIKEEEFGIIPMTNTKFLTSLNEFVTNIGTASGQTKASTGYTFTNIQKQSDQIYQNIINGKHPSFGLKASNKYKFYDSVLLNVLEKEEHPAWRVFHDMFTKLPASLVLNFLDEKTSVFQDLKIMSTVHTPTFLKSALQKLLD